MYIMKKLSIPAVLLFCFIRGATAQNLPVVLSTWEFTPNATAEAFDLMFNQGQDIVDSIVGGCTLCDLGKQCGDSVGHGDKPSETGEVTLDAMIMDGRSMETGAVGCLRRIKNAIGVAHAVLKYTDHSLLVGELAMDFAKQMGFPEEDLSSPRSDADWQQWQLDSCQPNFWQSVTPDPLTSCGPYTPIAVDSTDRTKSYTGHHDDHSPPEPDHDTIGMVAVDAAGNPASGTSTNGLSHKIAGRVGDSPIVGAGSFAEIGIGAAAATGNGDIMLRLLPSYHAVQQMAQGSTPAEAAASAIQRIVNYYPTFNGAVIAVNVTGGIGAACHGYTDFPYNYISPQTGGVINEIVFCNA